MDEFVRERILEPLGMEMTGISLSPDMKAQLVVGHDLSGKPTKNWDLPPQKNEAENRTYIVNQTTSHCFIPIGQCARNRT